MSGARRRETITAMVALGMLLVTGCAPGRLTNARANGLRDGDALHAGSGKIRTLRCVSRLPSGKGGPEPFALVPVVAKRKRAWEASLGGEEAARPHVRARMSGWPERLLADRGGLPDSDDEFLARLAADTWKGLAAFTDRENGLPVDNVRIVDLVGASAEPVTEVPGSPVKPGAPSGLVGDYTSSTNIGLYLAAVAAARDLKLISADESVARITKLFETLRGLETYHGFLYNFYDTTTLERTSNFISFVDAAWLLAGLIAVRATVPELAAEAARFIEQQDFRLFYDADKGLISHGYWIHEREPSIFHYGVFYSEARLGALLAIGKGDMPADVWRNMLRVPPPLCARPGPLVTGFLFRDAPNGVKAYGFYEWEGAHYVPSWGGSMFEALMPGLLIDEDEHSPRGLRRNNAAHVRVQREYATETLGYPVWGMSPCSTLDGSYSEYGVPVLGARGYDTGVVSPHASALALGVEPHRAVANLRALADRFDCYGDFGFYDAIDPTTGRVAHAYLTLDQAMIFLAAANRLDDGRLRRAFAADPIVAAGLPLLAAEEVPFK